MHLTLIRHIKTTAPIGLCYGQTDIGLPSGFEVTHAKIIKELADEQFDVIFSSPLQRCSILAKAIANNLQPVVFDDRLKELNFGEWEQKMWNNIEKLPESKGFFNDYINVTPPGGESFRHMTTRVRGFYDELLRNFSQKQVLIVSHGGPIRVFNAIIKEIEIKRIFDHKVGYGEILKYYI